MFEKSLIASQVQHASVEQRWTAAASITLQVAVVGLVIGRFGGQQRPSAGQRRIVRPGQNVIVTDADLFQTDSSRAAGRIQVLRHLDRDTGATAVQQQYVVTGRDQQQVAEAGAQHDTGVAIENDDDVAAAAERDQPDSE